MYPACWRSSCWRGGHSGLISWRYFFFGNQSRLRGFCGSCCFLGSCGRLIFFPCDVVHSFHLGFVWGGVGQGVRWGQVAIHQAKTTQALCTPTCPPALQTLIFSVRTSYLESTKLIENASLSTLKQSAIFTKQRHLSPRNVQHLCFARYYALLRVVGLFAFLKFVS